METPRLEIRRVKFLQKNVDLNKSFAVSLFLFGKVILTGESDSYWLFTGKNARIIVLKQISSADMGRIFSIWVNLIRRCGVKITEEAILVHMFAMCNNDIMD